jgi:small subunit ribosomal protein S9e
LGLLREGDRKLDYVLALTTENFLERRLQTLVSRKMRGTSIHKARVLIEQKHIAVGKQTVNIPSFMVRVSSEHHIQISQKSVFRTGALGRMKRRKNKGGDDD